MAARHRKHHGKAKGGEVVYEGKGSHVEHEAEDKTDGFKKGGKVNHHMEGHKAKHRLDKPHRAHGGKVGKSPFTSAHEGVPHIKGTKSTPKSP